MGAGHCLKQHGLAAGLVAVFIMLAILGVQQGFQSGALPE